MYLQESSYFHDWYLQEYMYQYIKHIKLISSIKSAAHIVFTQAMQTVVLIIALQVFMIII